MMRRSALRRRKPEPMGVRVSVRVKSSGHLEWIRGCSCLVENDECFGKIQAHHVREHGNAGTGLKPPDSDAVPLCVYHHKRLHDRGWRTFQEDYACDLDTAAADAWQKDRYHRLKYERQQER